jgi:AcrR family transcriptional regulator
MTTKRAQIQEAVLQATEELLAEVPFAELNIEKIATRAGISRTAFYFYFKDKRELLMRLCEEVTDELFAAADGWFSGNEGEQPIAEMRTALDNIATLYEVHGTLLRAIVEVSTYDAEFAMFWRGLLQRFVDASERRMQHLQSDLPAAPTAFALIWMTERALYQQMEQGIERGPVLDAIHGIWVHALYGRVEV